jgi:acid phosphatase (class A)
MKRTLVLCIVAVALTIAGAVVYTLNQSVVSIEKAREENKATVTEVVNKIDIDSFTFTNTQQWDPKLLRIASETPYYIDNWEKVISLPLPPGNSSEQTKEELKTSLSYKELRTEEKMKEINREANFETILFDGKLLIDYFDDRKFPRTAALLKNSFDNLTSITFQIKQKFNRVRPSFLEPDIDPVLEIPSHPAYPSGHSTQMHFLAYVFGELAPEKRPVFMAEADRIAKNREIAGLHYPSDSAAGKSLAEQYFKFLLKNKEFQTLLKDAKTEW